MTGRRIGSSSGADPESEPKTGLPPAVSDVPARFAPCLGRRLHAHPHDDFEADAHPRARKNDSLEVTQGRDTLAPTRGSWELRSQKSA